MRPRLERKVEAFLTPMSVDRQFPIIACSLALAIFSGCGSSRPASEPLPVPPPPIPLLAAIPEAPYSTVRVPVAVDLDYVAAKVLKDLPRPLVRDSLHREVQVIPMAPAVKIRVRYQAEMEALVLRLDGNDMTATARIAFRAGGTVESGGMSVGMASCGERTGEPSGAVEFTITGKLAWGPDGSFLFAPRPWALKWIRPCELTSLRVSLEDILNLPGVRGKVQSVVDDAVERLPEAIRIRPMAERIWVQASRPIAVAPGAFLAIRPDTLFLGALRGSGRVLNTSLALLARPKLFPDSTDSVKPMPPLRVETTPDRGFRIDLHGQLPLPVVDSALSAMLRGLRLENDGKPVRIERARIYGGGDKAVVAITFLEPFRGEVFLRGEPQYDSTADAIRFARLDFDVSSESFLLKTAATLLHGSIRQSIERAAVLPLGQILPSLAGRDFTLAEGVVAKVTISRLRPLGISLDDSTLQAWVRAEGTAAVTVGAK